jgi:hypothetical protein
MARWFLISTKRAGELVVRAHLERQDYGVYHRDFLRRVRMRGGGGMCHAAVCISRKGGCILPCEPC